MNRLQRNGGTAGVSAALLLIVGFGLFMSSGLDPAAASDPTRALPLIAGLGGRWSLMGLAFAVSVGLSMVFSAGLSHRLRDKAPTRAATLLYFAIVGLAMHALDSFILWQGATHLAAYMVKDQTAAAAAWVGMDALTRALRGTANGFLGVAETIGGWAIIETAALSAAVGWLGIAAGIVTLLAVFAPASIPVFLGRVVLTIVWLAWTGSQLRRTGTLRAG